MGNLDARETILDSILSSADHALRAARGSFDSILSSADHAFGRLEAPGAPRWADWAVGERRWAERGVSGCAASGPTHFTVPCSWEQVPVHVCACPLPAHVIAFVPRVVPRAVSALVRREHARSDAAVRVRASSPLEGSRPSRWWGRDSGLGSMKVPWMARVASRLCFCRVVLRYAVED